MFAETFQAGVPPATQTPLDPPPLVAQIELFASENPLWIVRWRMQVRVSDLGKIEHWIGSAIPGESAVATGGSRTDVLLKHSANDADGMHGVGPVHRLDEGLVMPLDPAGARAA